MRKAHMARFAVWAGLAFAASAAPAEVSVQVREAALRDAPSFLGMPAAQVTYGERLEVTERRPPWVRVRAADGRAGWLHESALTSAKLALAAGDRNVGAAASGDELALAGKGFSRQVEDAFRAENRDIDFTWVDRMEAWRVPPREVQGFLAEGGVRPAKGGTP